MNQWEKEVAQSLLNDEKAVLAELTDQYEKALQDIQREIVMFESDIARLDLALSDSGLSDEQKAILLSRKQAKVYQKQYQEALEGQLNNIMYNLCFEGYETINQYLTESYDNAFIGELYNLQKQGVPIIVPIDQKAAVRAILTNSKLSAGLYAKLAIDLMQMKTDITREVTRGIAKGMLYKDMARNLKNVSGVSLGKAKTIVRTEGHRIQEASRNDAQHRAKDIGADVVKQWDSALDSRTRESHVKLDGEIRELDEKFSNGLMYPGDSSGKAAEVINCRCRSNTRAKWALSAAQTKHLGNVEDMSDKQKKAIADKLKVPVEELDKYSEQIVPIDAKNYEDFKRQYKEFWHYEGSDLQKEAEARIAGYKTGKKLGKDSSGSAVDKLQYSGKVSSESVTTIEKAISKMPEHHRILAETKISGIEITESEIGNQYSQRTQKMQISIFSKEEDIVHEYGHALEYAMDIYRDPEFMRVMHKGLENISLDDIIYDEETFNIPIYRIKNDKFISAYQGRLYEKYGIYSGDEISLDGMLEYFSEGYMEYVSNPENLKKHDPDLFAYIERIKP